MSPNRHPRSSTGPSSINNYFRVTKPASRSLANLASTKSSQLSSGQAALIQRSVEAVDLTEAGPHRQSLDFYRSPARGPLNFVHPRPFSNTTRIGTGSDRPVDKEAPKFLALCINFNVPTPVDHYQKRYLQASASTLIQLHTGEPKSCIDFLTVYPQALPRVVALVLRIRHTPDPAQWIALLQLFIQGAGNLQYLDVLFAPPTERGSFPRCGANPLCENVAFLVTLGSLAEKINDKALAMLKIGGLFTNTFASYMRLRLGGEKTSLYLPPGWEKPRPIVFFSSAEDCEKNAEIAGLWNGFVWNIDVAEPTGLCRFLEKNPTFGSRVEEVRIRIYDEEGAQDWIELFRRLGREVGNLNDLKIYWDQLSRQTRRADINVLSVDDGIIESLASIRVRYNLVLVGLHAPLLVSKLEQKTGMVGRKMRDGNHVLQHQQSGRSAIRTRPRYD